MADASGERPPSPVFGFGNPAYNEPMPLKGLALYIALGFLAAWFAALCLTCWRLVRAHPGDSTRLLRTRLTIVGMAFSAFAVGSLLLIHLSWISVEVSQYLGARTIGILSLPLFWSTATGLALCSAGSGKVRFAGVGSSLLTGFWWFTMAVGAGISMGAPTIRHPTKFLIPEGYVGWVGVTYGEENAPPLPVENGSFICRIPKTGVLYTSFHQEEGGRKMNTSTTPKMVQCGL